MRVSAAAGDLDALGDTPGEKPGPGSHTHYFVKVHAIITEKSTPGRRTYITRSACPQFPVALETSTDTPGPMVELTAILLR